MWNGIAYDLTPHHEWIRDAELFSVLKRLVMFAKRPLFMVWPMLVSQLQFMVVAAHDSCNASGSQPCSSGQHLVATLLLCLKAFRKWHATVRYMRFTRRQQLLSDSLLILSPTFGTALQNVRRMTQV